MCKVEEQQHLLRTQYIPSIRRNAHQNTPTFLLSGRHGKTIKHDKYEFKWFEGDCMPQTVLEPIKTGQTPGNNASNKDFYFYFTDIL